MGQNAGLVTLAVENKLSSYELAEKILDLVKPNPDDFDYSSSIDWSQADPYGMLSQRFKDSIEAQIDVSDLEVKQDERDLSYKLERLLKEYGF